MFLFRRRRLTAPSTQRRGGAGPPAGLSHRCAVEPLEGRTLLTQILEPTPPPVEPTATIGAASLVAEGAVNHSVAVTFASSAGVDIATIDPSDVTATGDGGV